VVAFRAAPAPVSRTSRNSVLQRLLLPSETHGTASSGGGPALTSEQNDSAMFDHLHLDHHDRVEVGDFSCTAHSG
jgi:hypothetical protein